MSTAAVAVATGVSPLMGRGGPLSPLRALFQLMPAAAPAVAAEAAAERRALQREREEERAVLRRERAEKARAEQAETRAAMRKEREAIDRERNEMRRVQEKLRDTKVYGEERQALNRELEEHRQQVIASTRRIDSHTRALERSAMTTHAAHQERINERVREGEPTRGQRAESDARMQNVLSQTRNMRDRTKAIRDSVANVKPDVGAYRPSSPGYHAKVGRLNGELGALDEANERELAPLNRAATERGGEAASVAGRTRAQMERERAADVRLDERRARVAKQAGGRLRTNGERMRAQHEQLQRAIEDGDRAAADTAATNIEKLSRERIRDGQALHATVSTQHAQREAHRDGGVSDAEVTTLHEDDERVRQSATTVAENARRAADEMRVGPIADNDRLIDESEEAATRLAARAAEPAETQVQYERRRERQAVVKSSEVAKNEETKTKAEAEAAPQVPLVALGGNSVPSVPMTAVAPSLNDGMAAGGGGGGGGLGGFGDSDDDDDDDDDEPEWEEEDEEEEEEEDPALRDNLVQQGVIPAEVAHARATSPWRESGVRAVQDEVAGFLLIEWMGRDENNTDRPIRLRMRKDVPLQRVNKGRFVRIVLEPESAVPTLNMTWKTYLANEHMSDDERCTSVLRSLPWRGKPPSALRRLVDDVYDGTLGTFDKAITGHNHVAEHRVRRTDWTRPELQRDKVPPDVPLALVLVTQVNRPNADTRQPDDYVGQWRYDIGGYVADKHAFYGARVDLRTRTGYFMFQFSYEEDIDAYVHESDVALVPTGVARLRFVFARADWSLMRVEYIMSEQQYTTLYARTFAGVATHSS